MPYSETRILPREHITQTLHNAVLNHSLVVLTAPMGYGKTTAARALVRQVSHRNFYITVNPGMHGALYLWDRMCSQVQAQGSEMAPVFRECGFPSDTIQIQRLFDYGRKYLAGRPTLLVIDDYHFAHAPECDNLIELLVREQMPGFTIMMLSRTKPAMHLDELRIKGLAAVFDQSLLAFSQEETREYFQLHGVDNPDTVSKAWHYSEGWVASLWLSLQGIRTSGALLPVRDMDGLLENAVFAQYSPEERRLLLQLSILDSFTPRQAAMVTGDASAPLNLVRLQEGNSFLSYEPSTDSYRMHSIFRTFLHRHLEADREVDKAALYFRAGEMFAAEGDVHLALRSFAKAGSEAAQMRILEIFSAPRDGLLVLFDPEGMAAIFRSIPWPVRFRCPIGYLGFVYHYMSRVGIAEALPLLNEAEQRFAAEKSLSPAMKRRIQGEIAVIHGIDAFNDLFAMRDLYKKAHILLNGRSSISHRRLVCTFGSPHAAFLYLRNAGTYAQLLDLIQNNLHYYQDLADGCGMGAQDLFQAEYLLETGALEKVEDFIMKSVYRAGTKDQTSTIIAANFTLARLLLAQEPEEDESGAVAHKALALLRDLEPQVQRTRNPLLVNSLDMSLGYICSVIGLVQDIPAWLRDGDLTAKRNFYQGLGFRQIVYSRALMLQQDFLRLEIFAQDMHASLGRYKTTFGSIHSYVLEAIAVLHQRNVKDAAQILRKALELAQQDSILMTVAEYGEHILPIVQYIQDAAPGDPYLASLMPFVRHYAGLTSGNRPQMLSPREREILELAAQGKTNSAIAAILGIKLITVGKTLTRAYKKLGAANRVDALQKVEKISR